MTLKILYDHQAFRTGKYSGIPRYFAELYLQYIKSNAVTPIFPEFWTNNQDYRNLPIKHPNFTWYIRDKIVDISIRYLHQNPSRLIDGAEKKTIKLLNKQDFSLFHPTRLEPYFLKHIGKKPYLLTIHDLTYELYPELFPLSSNVYANTRQIVENASRFIAVSESTKRDFISYYHVDSSLVDVVYHGSLFEKYHIPAKKVDCSEPNEKYLLFVNGRDLHKNFYHFVEAAAPILLSENIKLICAGGGILRNDEKMFLRTLGIEHLVTQKSVSDAELIHLYQNALAFVFPSINEGFGLPILEAFSCGCPVICSNTSCLPEIAGNAAEYFNPKDVESIRDTLQKVICDEILRNNMRNNGYKQLEKFSWRKCAEETRTVYEKAISV